MLERWAPPWGFLSTHPRGQIWASQAGIVRGNLAEHLDRHLRPRRGLRSSERRWGQQEASRAATRLPTWRRGGLTSWNSDVWADRRGETDPRPSCPGRSGGSDLGIQIFSREE